MTDGATGLRQRHAQQTAHDLSTTARRLAAERGLAGFTVEQACEQVGVSRRTFFNYFASKEDAILGRSIRRGDDGAVEAFLAGGTGGASLSATLLDDLAALHAERWETLGMTRETVVELRAVLEREPRLLSRLLEVAQEDEAADVALVARREGLSPDDLRATTAVHLIGALAKASAWKYLEAEPDGALATTFADGLAGRLAAARTLLGARP